MSTVDAIETCQKCQGDKHSTFNCHTSELHEFCFSCGTSFHEFLVEDDKGNYVKNEEGKVILDAEKEEGVGVACITTDKLTKYNTLTNTDDDTIDKWLETLQDPSVNRDESYLTVLNEDGVHCLAGEIRPF